MRVNPASILGHHGAPKTHIISGPFTQEKDGLKVTLWVTQECIDCDISRENCPAVYEHNYEAGQTKIKEKADFFAELENVKRAQEQCPTNALGIEVSK
jgi:ferredoxin